MGMDVGGESGGSLSNPNVVPLIDILLVLIIIFMVITPLTPKGLDTLVPQPSPNQQQNVELENKTVVVQIANNGKLKINNEDTTWYRLGHERRSVDRYPAGTSGDLHDHPEVLQGFGCAGSSAFHREGSGPSA